MPDAFYSLPIAQMALWTAIAFVGSYWLGCFFARPILRLLLGGRERLNWAVGATLSTFGVLYGLLLSLLAVAGYQNLETVEKEANAEAAALLALYVDVAELPPETAAPIQDVLRDYCSSIIEDEWPIQRQGKIPLASGGHVKRIRTDLLSLDASEHRTKLVQRLALDEFGSMTSHGRQRRYAATVSIPALMWYVVVAGTVVNYMLMWLFEMRLFNQLILGGAVAFFLGAIILLIAVMDRPYRSAKYGVTPEPFVVVQTIMERNAPADPGASLDPPK
ncbi:MAG: hypothetical protein AAF726_12030 [Planctomycetota bacterium]